MHVDAERRLNSLSPEFLEEFWRYGKIRNDPRITRVGYWLRKYSLDELPQIINVLRGEMSLVGPRPYLFSQLKQLGLYSNEIFSVKPGLTGLWQISGRSEVTTEERVSMDTYYIRNWSIWMDLYILARTVWVVLTRKGAY
jgi:lipopolysaccharide/colanic/teichoic acid biosynthesis glycosyltransferase